MEKEKLKIRIEQKIEQIEEYLEFLLSKVPNEIEKYKKDLTAKAVCERYAEKIIQSVIDLAFYVINIKKFIQPMEEERSFIILQKNNIITEKLAKSLIEAKGMRNFIIHEYGKIDDEIIFESISNQLEKDVREFITSVRKSILEEIKQ